MDQYRATGVFILREQETGRERGLTARRRDSLAERRSISRA
jgi:hypothetical protein